MHARPCRCGRPVKQSHPTRRVARDCCVAISTLRQPLSVQRGFRLLPCRGSPCSSGQPFGAAAVRLFFAWSQSAREGGGTVIQRILVICLFGAFLMVAAAP